MLTAMCPAKISRNMPKTSVCGIYVSVSSWDGRPRALRREDAEPKETETDMENGVKEVNTFLDGKETDDVPEPTIIGSTVKMKRGTASHKTERTEGRFDLAVLVAFQCRSRLDGNIQVFVL